MDHLTKERFQVLAVERDPYEALVILTALHDPFYTVLFTEDRTQTRTLLQENNGSAISVLPHLILLDLTSTQEDLHDLLNEFKSDPKLRYIPVIVICSDRQDEVSRSYRLGANCCIRKSTDRGEFSARLAEAVTSFSSMIRRPSMNAQSDHQAD
jgi:CheY-like chemotaxis protein